MTKDIPPYCIAAGNPARVIKTIDEFIEDMKKNAAEDKAACGSDNG